MAFHANPTNNNLSARPPYLPSAPAPEPPAPIAYEHYLTSISTFTFPSGTGPQTADAIREHMAYLCHTKSAPLQHAVLQVPGSEIPGGTWDVAFAPGVLGKGWVVVFGARESAFVWCLWPGVGEGADTEGEMVEFLATLVGRGVVRPEKEMRVGEKRHERFYRVVRQALWVGGVSGVLGMDWRSGEFGGMF